MKHHFYSGTRTDHIVGGHPPKRRPPRPDSWVFIVRPRDDPPDGWRPDGLDPPG